MTLFYILKPLFDSQLILFCLFVCFVCCNVDDDDDDVDNDNDVDDSDNGG